MEPLIPRTNNIKNILDKYVKNLHPNLEEIIIKEILILNIKTVREILKFIKNKLELPAIGSHTNIYWKKRGWSDIEILNKRIKHDGSHSPMIIENWLNKTNKITGKLYTIDEATYKINSFRKLNKEYWKERGFNEEESITKIKEYQKENSNKRDIKIIENPEKYLSTYPTQIKYWKSKGFSNEDASIKLNEFQDKLSLKAFIKRNGEEIGTIKYNEYLVKVAYTSSRKYYINKYGEKVGNEKYDNILSKRITPMSKSSKESFKFLLPIYKFIRKHGISISDIYWGVGKSNEWFINYENNLFFYDFTILSLKIIIEYNGIKFHPNPNWDNHRKENWKSLYSNINYENKIVFDNLKKETAIMKGFNVISVYSDDDLELKQNEIIKIFENLI